jgi:hypothetical protein
MKSLRGFEVTSLYEARVEAFLKAVDAVDTAIDWGWNTVVVGHENDPDEFRGFGYSTRSPEELRQCTDQIEVELAYVDEPLPSETVRSLGLWQAIEEEPG